MSLRCAAYRKKYYGVRAFFWGLLLAACVVIPVMVYDSGYFLYYGDFNSQQMMFYHHANEVVRDAGVGWDWGTDLGSNFIG